MLVEFSIVPMGKGDSISTDVAKIIDLIDKSGLPYKTHAMGTLVEGEWDQVMALIKQCHDLLKENAPRVYTRIAIDDKGHKTEMMSEKLKSVENKLGRKFNK